MVRCGLCSTEISQPVCPLCLTDKFEAYIERKKISLVKQYREQVRNILDKTRYGKISCSNCRGQHEKAICAACFANKLCSWLETKDEALAKQFISDFNFTKVTSKILYA